MIRGLTATLILLALLLWVPSATPFEKIEITKAHRLINLSGSYAGETIKISFVANEDAIDHFTYLTPFEYDNKISKIWFSRSDRDKTSLHYSKSIYTYVLSYPFRRGKLTKSTE